ncbi:TRAP transporter substrate-binding protein DctP [Sulfitobacter sp. PS-8MA]|uniref:TRAP transporter substrate-binding protein DctP n=1 Tax=Sulfitobacter sp. PS-8MA TaxID=3237707 RepID=UPI0034C5EAF2
MFTQLGANLVRTAPGEVYSALERGAIDGYGWPSQGVLDLGWDEQTKYRVDPSFYNVDVNLLVNLDTWNGLTDEQRAKLEEGAAWMEELNHDNAARNKAEYAAQAEAGIETITFGEADAETWTNAARDAGWAAVAEVDADLAQEMRACMTK